ncbi:guanylate-binding protein 1-like [Sinocyclocheilus anshuiensis]|uniref:guanylate-binding protein 1-like n=1 Tax=Sinocyclocheilus anshuiensis TaxID=1608454 RepID=UPI0007B98437|nr:PREDICTED: guanylate-binding protein 1-like [Sinocyclocheilus anshuiensis]
MQLSLAKIQNIRAVEEALQFYMTEMLSMAQLPMRPEELSDIHKIAEKKAVEVFISMSFNDNDQIYQQELMVFDTLEKGVFDGSYPRSGGYRQYRDMLRHLTNDYRARTHSQIMVQKRAFKDMQRTHKEHVNQIICQMEKEQERMRRDNERVLEAKLREKDALLQKGLQEQASKMQRQIDRLRSEMHKEEKSKPFTVSRIMDGIGATAELILPGFVSRGLSAVWKWFK